MKQVTTLKKLKYAWGIDPASSETGLTEDDNSILDYIQELLGTERIYFVERKPTLDQNISQLYGLIWVQFTPALKEEVIEGDNYGVKSN